MKNHVLATLAMAVMAMLAMGSTESNANATASDARTIGYSTVYARHPGASASIKTVDDLGNGKFHVAGRLTKKDSSSEQGFYIEMQFDPGEKDSARIIEFDTIQ